MTPQDLEPRELHVGDVVTYMVRNTLMGPDAPKYLSRGEWEITNFDDHTTSPFVAVDDDGCAYTVPALTIRCRCQATSREEPLIFPLDLTVTVQRKTT
jgi:hypothetical protein